MKVKRTNTVKNYENRDKNAGKWDKCSQKKLKIVKNFQMFVKNSYKLKKIKTVKNDEKQSKMGEKQ